jgi:hypothetical protein
MKKVFESMNIGNDKLMFLCVLAFIGTCCAAGSVTRPQWDKRPVLPSWARNFLTGALILSALGGIGSKFSLSCEKRAVYMTLGLTALAGAFLVALLPREQKMDIDIIDIDVKKLFRLKEPADYIGERGDGGDMGRYDARLGGVAR